MRTEKIEAAEVSQEMPHFIIEAGTQEQSRAQPSIEEGLTITDFRLVVEQVLLIGYHSATFECTTQHLQVIGMKRSGLRATITLKCKMCQYEAEVQNQSADNKTMDLHSTTALATITCGGGYSQMEDILNILSHVFGEHKECRRLGYFCDRPANTGEDNLVPHLKKIGIYNRMHEIFRPLMAHAESLLYNTTNNSVENLNAIIAKYTGGKRINWGQRGSYSARCAAAVVQHNTQKLISKVIEGKGAKPPKLIEELEERRKGSNEKGKERERKSSKKVRNPFCSTTDPDYGVSAEKPDMEQHLFNFEKERHMEMLQDWQTNRKKIERDTAEQNKSHEWHTYRSKLLTASNFGKVCRRRKTTKCGNLVKSLLYPNILQLPAIEYGRQCENIAREQLAKEEDVEIRKCGLFIDAEIPFLGATPDGIIDDDGIVEIKCPKTAEKFSPEEAIKNIQPLRRIFEDDAGTALRRTHHYF
nr:uncharacterized protein LOC117227708 [Megalopta genalis]